MSVGRLAGVAGILLCAVAVVWRLEGNAHLMKFEVGTLLQAGTTAVVIGCFLLLLGQANRH